MLAEPGEGDAADPRGEALEPSVARGVTDCGHGRGGLQRLVELADPRVEQSGDPVGQSQPVRLVRRLQQLDRGSRVLDSPAERTYVERREREYILCFARRCVVSSLPREIVTLATSYGPIPFKVSRLEGRVVTVTPEFADVARIAKEKALPVREVLDQARAEGRRLLSDR